jgi:hypothetical protein
MSKKPPAPAPAPPSAPPATGPLLTREEYDRKLRAYQPASELRYDVLYDDLMDHDAALRAEVERLKPFERIADDVFNAYTQRDAAEARVAKLENALREIEHITECDCTEGTDPNCIAAAALKEKP